MSELLPCPTSFVPVHPKALAFLKDAALIKSGLGKLSLYSLKKIGLTDDECTAVMYIYGIAEAFDFPCASPTPTPEGAKVEAIPSFKELERLREKKDDEFLAWVADIPDKHWSRYDLSAVRLGYEFGRKIERRAPELAGGWVMTTSNNEVNP